MNAVFLDTSALLPLLDRDDADHEAVVAALESLVEKRTALVTSSYVLVEAGALIRNRLGIVPFRRLGETIDCAAEVIWVDEGLHRKAWERAARSRRGPSLVDHVSFLVMKQLGISAALTLDRHFQREGFEALPVAAR